MESGVHCQLSRGLQEGGLMNETGVSGRSPKHGCVDCMAGCELVNASGAPELWGIPHGVHSTLPSF